MKTINSDIAMSENTIQNIEKNELVSIESNPVQVLSIISGLVKRENFDIDALEKLIKLLNDAEDRQAKRAFNLALSEMMGKIPVIAKTGKNTFNGTKFAKLEDVVEITRPILNEHGFSVTYKQTQEMIPNAKTEPNSIFCMMTVICFLKHRDGHEESNEIQLPIATIKGQTPIQAMGMGSTYGRRYTLMQALNIATSGDDNDGYSESPQSVKKSITDDQLTKGIDAINKGSYTVEKMIATYELTTSQVLRLGREVSASE